MNYFKPLLAVSLGIFLNINFSIAQVNNYYNSATNLNGYALKSALNKIIAQKTISWNYRDLPIIFEQTDRDFYYENDSSLIDIYSEKPLGQDPYNYTYDVNSLIAGASQEGMGWNREHIYSQSFFNSAYPMYADLHFIVPTDARVNQRRSNYPYGKVNTPAFTSLNGTKVGPANMQGYTNTVTEPIDEFKGDVARMLFYVAVRYENLIPSFNYANVRNPLDSLSEKAFKNWTIQTLLTWHLQDPVSQKEIDRNEAIYAIQGNRNPFIDHPSYAQNIWSAVADSTIPTAPWQIELVNNGSKFLSIEWSSNAQDTNILGFEVFLNNVNVGTTANNYFTLHHLEANTNYEIKVRSYSKAYIKSDFDDVLIANTLATDTFSNDLYVSKLIVGSNKNKAIEITNNLGYAVDLKDYFINIRQQNNSSGALYWSSNKIQLEGTLLAGKNMVIMNPDAMLSCFNIDSAAILSNADPLQLNGKMAIELSYKNNTIDRLGNPNVIADYAANKSLYRLNQNPNAAFDTAEWEVFPIDYCEGLGENSDITSMKKVKKSKAKKYSFYPNPNQGILNIEGEGFSAINDMKILDVEGKTLAQFKKPFKTKNSLNLPKNVFGNVFIWIDGVSYPIVILH